MALYSRKLLLAEKSQKKYASSCYMCYVCPDDCYFPPPPPPPPSSSQSQPSASPKHQMSTILTFMLCVLGAAFLVLSYLTIRRYRNCRRRGSAAPGIGASFRDGFLVDENHGPVVDHHIWFIRTVGLPESVIDSIAVFKFKRGEGLIDGSDCSVCLSEFEEDETLRLLPKCSHAFHVPCIDTWLRSHKNCPVCRAPITIGNSNNNHNDRVLVNSLEMNTDLPDLESDEVNHQRQSESETDHDQVQIDQVRENGDFDSRIEKFRVLSDLADHRVNVDQELKPVRRSASMDLSSASSSMITKPETVEKQNSDIVVKRGGENSSIYKMIKSSSSMRRSFSFSGKRSLRKSSRSLEESIPIQEVMITTQNRSQSMIIG